MKPAEAAALALPVASIVATGVYLAAFPPNTIHVTKLDYAVQAVAFVSMAAGAVLASRLSGSPGDERVRRAANVLMWVAAVWFMVASFNTCNRPYGD